MEPAGRRGQLARLGTALAVIAAALLAGCGKPPPPVVDPAVERAEATKRAQERDFGGNAVKSLEAAKNLQSDVNKLATESVDKAEKDAK